MNKYEIGDIFKTNCGIDCQVIGKGSKKQEILIKWLDEFGHEMFVRSGNLRKGAVYNPYSRSMQGVGYVGLGKFSPTKNGIRTLEYSTWKGMFHRSYAAAYHDKKPSYVGCSVHEAWHDFQCFGEWAVHQVGWGEIDFQIDKDLLGGGSKVYGPDTCVMLPRKINMVLQTRSFKDDGLPCGVHWDSERELYVGQSKGSKPPKRFASVEQAYVHYKEAKEFRVMELAEIYKGRIDERAYEKLKSFQLPEYSGILKHTN